MMFMSYINIPTIIARFDAHVQAYLAWRNRETEAYWLQTVMEDRAESAAPPVHLREWRQ